MQIEKKLGIFGGTYEGRLLAEFCRNKGINAVVSVATAYGSELLDGEVKTGRMDAREMAQWIEQQNISVVIDATHPFAQAASQEIRLACTATHADYLRLKRSAPEENPRLISPQQTEPPGNVSWVSSYQEAVALLTRELFLYPERKALLTTGSKELSCFTAEKSLIPRLFVRVLPSVEAIQACHDAGFSGKQIMAMQGPFSFTMNHALIRTVQASYLVTKESGQAGGFREKIEAALQCGCHVITIRRPEEKQEGKSLEELKEWLLSRKSEFSQKTKTSLKTESSQKTKISLKSEFPQKTEFSSRTKQQQEKHIKKEREIVLMGIGMGNLKQITWEGIQALGQADAFLGASRMVETGKTLCRQIFAQLPPFQDERMPDKQEKITYKKEEILSWLNEHPEIIRPVILFSGDTGFYSGAKGVLQLLKANCPASTAIRLLPGISSLSYFAARIGRPWESTEPLSFHGREEEIDWSLSDGKERFFLLDGTKRLHQICRNLIACGQSGAAVWIGENLSYPTERIVCLKPEAVLHTAFEPLLVCWIIPSAPA